MGAAADLEPGGEEVLQPALQLQLLQRPDGVVVACVGHHLHELVLQEALLCCGQSAQPGCHQARFPTAGAQQLQLCLQEDGCKAQQRSIESILLAHNQLDAAAYWSRYKMP